MKILIDRKTRKLLIQGDTVPREWTTVVGEKSNNAFEVFRNIHSLVDDEEAIAMVACDVIKEFCDDNVKYLELRTTPKSNAETGMTKKTYIDSVIRGIHNSLSHCKDNIDVRLLLSIDRRQSMPEAYETLQLASEYTTVDYMQGKVVGIDLSGDPMAGDSRDIASLLEEAKHRGFKLAVHVSERPNRDEDSNLLLTVNPDRLGHATFLHLGTQGAMAPAVNTVINNNIPIELCLSSNVKIRTVKSFDEHQLKFWNGKNHPYIICTDDKGVFSTTLSYEYFIAANTFGFTEQDLYKLSQDSFKFIFDDKYKLQQS
jgi:adenosine deaminase